MKKMEIHVNRGILLEKGTLGPTIKKARFYLKKVVKSWERVHCLVKRQIFKMERHVSRKRALF